MIQDFRGKIAVLTGAASGFGLECARIGASHGMKLVLVDVQQDALDHACAELRKAGAEVLPCKVDVSDALEMEELSHQVREHFGTPHLVFNNAGVLSSGLLWEYSVPDWEWILGVDLWGVINGVRVFTPMMLQAAAQDPSYQGHVVNTASMAGLLCPPNMGAYNTAKAAVVSLTETLFHDLGLVTDRIGVSLLCPYFVPTGIASSQRNRPPGHEPDRPSASQIIGQAMISKAVDAGKVTARQVARQVFDAVGSGQFYIYSHPRSLGNVSSRMENLVSAANPADPFRDRPELGKELRARLRGSRV